ncbi:MAG: alpha/beta hydrolase, partial [Aliifodinibius sp.]|nr:alpha/beta hydrolase [Fodinibius sp.]NIV15394.1 alpha/beta hydrolase [Fodinibius sp.]NIY29255.1 alpha/beta hydrolase [Fodinibius sp.]
ALIHHDVDREDIHKKLKLGNLIMVGSDVDREVFSAYLADGALNVPQHMSIYVSDKDKALGFARWLTRRYRLGQMVDAEELSPV